MIGRIKAYSRVAGALICAALAFSSQAYAGSIEVFPVMVELIAPAMSGVLTVGNRSGRTTSVQVRAFEWTQDNTGDALAATRALLVSPPIFTVPAGGSQTVRVVLRKPAEDRDVAYRLLLDELPDADAPSAIHLALRISLPVFARPSVQTHPSLQWRVQMAEPGLAELVAVNEGSAAERLAEMKLVEPHIGTFKAVPLTNAWVLPGVERHWKVPLPDRLILRNDSQIRISVMARAGSVAFPASVVRAP